VRAIARQLGAGQKHGAHSFCTVKLPPSYDRAPQSSCLDAFHNRIAEILTDWPAISAVRVREILQPEGYSGGLTILREYLRSQRPQPVHAFQRTRYARARLANSIGPGMPDPVRSPT